MSETTWKTGITKVQPNKLLLRGYPIDTLVGQISFSQAVFLSIKGELPGEREAKMMDAMMVSSIDHGVTPPSCLAARTIASAGAPLNAAIAGGVLAISKHHGGAIEDAMGVFQAALALRRDSDTTVKKAAEGIIHEYRDQKKRLPGFGHRFHSEDPRARKLFQLARDLHFAGEYVEMAGAIESGITKIIGRKLPLNVDGALAALLCEMDFPSALANAFFIMARMPGLVAHVYEEQVKMRPMRHIDSKEHVYDGPPERKFKNS